MIRFSRSRVTIAIGAMAMGLLFVRPIVAQAGQDSGSTHINASPVIETVTDTLAFISWTTQNPGGTILHNAVVRYGKDPNNLHSTAESPTRINPSHAEMVFRVRMHNLEPATTYYYRVYSEQANGIADPAMSGVNQFTTLSTNRVRAKK